MNKKSRASFQKKREKKLEKLRVAYFKTIGQGCQFAPECKCKTDGPACKASRKGSSPCKGGIAFRGLAGKLRVTFKLVSAVQPKTT